MSKLEELQEAQVVCFTKKDDNTMLIMELCDHYFGLSYSKADMQQLVDELQAITDNMD